jgi:hypothetical protein
LLIVGAVVAVVLVLVAGALRSDPSPPPLESAGSSSGPSNLGLVSLPPDPSAAPSVDSSASPAEPTPVPSLRGEYVGGLGFYSVCMLLFVRGESYELVLPDGFRIRKRGGRAVIVDDRRMVVAGEGDLVGLNGKVGGRGSFCIVGPRLHVSKIVDVVARNPE